MKKTERFVIDYKKDKEFKCMLNDAHLVYNLLEQKTRHYKEKTDYIQPGLLSGQTLSSVIRETLKSINNHLDNFDRNNKLLF